MHSSRGFPSPLSSVTAAMAAAHVIEASRLQSPLPLPSTIRIATLCVLCSDTDIGMTRQELADCLGTIAQSGTAKFLKALKASKDAGSDNNLIGQFGVGFYSAFLVSDRVGVENKILLSLSTIIFSKHACGKFCSVSTKSPKSDRQYVWEGEANASSYTIREEIDTEKLIPRGTHLTLYVKVNKEILFVLSFAHPERVQKLVKNYSQLVSFPIYTWQEKGFTKEVEIDEDVAEAKKDEQDEKAELRNPKEVTTEKYNEFCKKSFNEYLEPLASSHFTTEGEVEFKSILYIPAVPPMGG
ncbi:hypothetical protein L1049_020317 [Liquidambar formosana]|uniref:Heat shock protein 90 n=1 Tax=Liquidambar formosana TaxID=63359 RepID=A0AAP0SCY6_LIQFO